MALDATRLGQAMVDAIKAAGITLSAEQETATLTAMTAIATAIVVEIDDNAELNATSTGTPGVID